MRFLAYGPIAGMAGALFADAIGALPTLPPQILQTSELLVLAWTIWYVLARYQPAQTAALAAQRKDFLEALKDARKNKEDG